MAFRSPSIGSEETPVWKGGGGGGGGGISQNIGQSGLTFELAS